MVIFHLESFTLCWWISWNNLFLFEMFTHTKKIDDFATKQGVNFYPLLLDMHKVSLASVQQHDWLTCFLVGYRADDWLL